MREIKRTWLLTLAMACTLPIGAQAATPAPAQTPAPAAAPTAFFYQQPVVLERAQHAKLHLKTGDARFAAHTPVAPVVLSEFAAAALEYPIVFSKTADGHWLALAITSLQPNSNAFVDAQGRWLARYVPISVRRYPFILSKNAQGAYSLAVDLVATEPQGPGPAIFDAQGQPSALVKEVLPQLLAFQQQADATDALAQALDQAGVLKPNSLQVRVDQRSTQLDGFWVVDEAKLRALSDEQALAWFKSGALSAIDAHLISLRNLVRFLAKDAPQPAQGS